MRRLAEAFELADLRPLFDAIDDNVVWKSAATTPGVFRFGGTYTNRAGVVQVMSQIASAYSIRRFQPKEIITRGNVVWGWFDVEADYRPGPGMSGIARRVEFEAAVRWRLKSGKIVEHQAFFDTQRVLRQQQGEPRGAALDSPVGPPPGTPAGM